MDETGKYFWFNLECRTRFIDCVIYIYAMSDFIRKQLYWL